MNMFLLSQVLMVIMWVAAETAAGTSPCTKCDGWNVTCLEGVCRHRCEIQTSYGECEKCLDFMFWGQQCENTCSNNCLNSRCQLMNSRVVCTDGCVDGKKGDNCRVDCPPSCKQCERDGDKCVGSTCANSLYYGDGCEEPCPANCMTGCNRSGHCYSCKTGFSGGFCNITCPLNCTQCEQYGNRCVGTCSISQLHGARCEKSCRMTCKGGCKRNGECSNCVDGYSGTFCNVTCPPNCTQCDRHTNKCVLPCPVTGYYGDNCEIKCLDNCRGGCERITGWCHDCAAGYRGKYCTTACVPNCQLCDLNTGRCQLCKEGKWGQFCNETCSFNCNCSRITGLCVSSCFNNTFYGKNCQHRCSLACDGCEKETGVCINCAARYSRTYCDEMCSLCSVDDKNCESNTCTPREPQLLLKVMLGVFSVLVIAGIILSISLYMYRKRHDKKDESTKISAGPSDQRQYWNSKYYEINDDDLDSHSSTHRPPPPADDRHQPLLLERDQHPLVSVTARNDIPSPCQDKSVGSLLPDVDSQIYEACGVSGPDLSIRASTSSCQSDDFQIGKRMDILLFSSQHGDGEAQHSDGKNSKSSMESEDPRLSKEKESTIHWEDNLSQMNVKYITPNIPESSC